jgi:hypothetical protein
MDKQEPVIPSIKAVYIKNKDAFEIVGFIAVLTALFLQIPITNNSHLKNIQALLLLLLIMGLIYLLLIIFREVFLKIEDKYHTYSFGLLYAGVSTFFMAELVKFALSIFQEQYLLYWKYVQMGIFLVLAFFTDRIMEFLTKIFGKEKLWKIIGCVIPVLLLYIIFDHNRFYLNPKLGLEVKIEYLIGLILIVTLDILYFVFKAIKFRTVILVCVVYGIYTITITTINTTTTKLVDTIFSGINSFIETLINRFTIILTAII